VPKPPESGTRQSRGLQWEHAAGAYLESRGLEILKRRYRCRAGELDLVCRDGGTLVIVEVRARSSGSLVGSLETVDYRKRRKLLQATRHLLMRHPAWSRYPIRFDVVGIDGIDRADAKLAWIRDAFSCDDAGFG
jgi:putative endonuclease